MFIHSCSTVARYLLDLAEKEEKTLTPMKLIKLVYISHGWMLGLHGRPLIRENTEAWRYGPVIPELYHQVKEFRSKPVDPEKVIPEPGVREFDPLECRVMNEVFEIYGKRTAIQLSQLTHSKNTPWYETYYRDKGSLVIPDDLIEDHYARMYEKFKTEPSA